MKNSILRRGFIYGTGLLFVSVGIVLCVKCRLGVSPISNVPYVLGFVFPVSFGMLTMLFHLINTSIQYILQKKLLNVKVWLQIPVAFLFGFTIDLISHLLSFTADSLLLKVILMLLSIFFTALGMHFMLSMQLVQNPPDGTVRQIALMTKRSIGSIKVSYDLIMVLTSVILSLVFFRQTKGIGLATICSAVLVGRTLSFFQKKIPLSID